MRKKSNLLPSATEYSIYTLGFIALIQTPATIKESGPAIGIIAVLAVILGVKIGISSTRED
ncbi:MULTISPECIES: hypothetical protein [Kocuria]|uniref:hypothetical protein n=1 Tax=Kocuria TaxID=57493 RepID=UPI000F89D4C4|nr:MULTISPECIES: hypothetical protein [Kocuria]MCT1367165.1 hypothetical protein [Rothia sp. p3-SID1597]